MDNLTEIYPFGKISSKHAQDPDVLALPYGQQWYLLPKAKLSATEIKLLQNLYPTTSKQLAQDHPWYGILFQNEPVSTPGLYRILQIQLHSMPDYSKKEWQESLQEMLRPKDFFPLNDNQIILVEQQNKQSFSVEDLKGIFATLDADFDATTKVFAGNFFDAKENFSVLFAEEQKIFQMEMKRNVQASFISLTQAALDYLVYDGIEKSPLMKTFRRELLQDAELLEIITTLWQNQGNVSSTAKALYMHRNTLQYRLDKFHELTGFQLKNLEDLTLCYLLIQH